jgi:hypothetical protein
MIFQIKSSLLLIFGLKNEKLLIFSMPLKKTTEKGRIEKEKTKRDQPRKR